MLLFDAIDVVVVTRCTRTSACFCNCNTMRTQQQTNEHQQKKHGRSRTFLAITHRCTLTPFSARHGRRRASACSCISDTHAHARTRAHNFCTLPRIACMLHTHTMHTQKPNHAELVLTHAEMCAGFRAKDSEGQARVRACYITPCVQAARR